MVTGRMSFPAGSSRHQTLVAEAEAKAVPICWNSQPIICQDANSTRVTARGKMYHLENMALLALVRAKRRRPKRLTERTASRIRRRCRFTHSRARAPETGIHNRLPPRGTNGGAQWTRVNRLLGRLRFGQGNNPAERRVSAMGHHHRNVCGAGKRFDKPAAFQATRRL